MLRIITMCRLPFLFVEIDYIRRCLCFVSTSRKTLMKYIGKLTVRFETEFRRIGQKHFPSYMIDDIQMIWIKVPFALVFQHIIVRDLNSATTIGPCLRRTNARRKIIEGYIAFTRSGFNETIDMSQHRLLIDAQPTEQFRKHLLWIH